MDSKLAILNAPPLTRMPGQTHLTAVLKEDNSTASSAVAATVRDRGQVLPGQVTPATHESLSMGSLSLP
jgi:hypothetical protein